MRRLLLISVLLIACEPAIRINGSYRRSVGDKPTLAIVPVLNETSGASDVAFEAAFDKVKERSALVPIKPMRERLLRESGLRDLLIAVAQRAGDKDDLQRAPKVQDIIGSAGLDQLRGAFGSADVLLFPVSFESKVSLGSTFDWMTYRLYDLRDGRIVFERARDLHADKDNENARRVLLLYLAVYACQDFEEHFLEAK